MKIQKIEEAHAVLNNNDIRLVEEVLAAIDAMNVSIESVKAIVKNIYDPDRDTWTVWCNTNLSNDEKNYIKQVYGKIETVSKEI